MLWNCTLVNLAPYRPLHWAVPRCHLAVTGRLPPRVALHRQAPATSIFIKDSSAVSCVCYYQCLSINLKAPAGQPPSHCRGTVHESQGALCWNAQNKHTQTQSFHTPAYPQRSNEHSTRQFADNSCSLIIDNNYRWKKDKCIFIFQILLTVAPPKCWCQCRVKHAHDHVLKHSHTCSPPHTHTHTHREGPTRVPHVMLTQFRSVAQSRAGIQNKKDSDI